MATVSADLKRLFLRGLKWDAEDAAATLYATLKTSARAKLKSTSLGLVLVATTSKGHAAQYQLPNGGAGFTPSNIAELTEELIQLYDRSKADLIAAGTPAPTDDQIFTEMMDWLKPVRETRGDYSCLRE